MAWNRTLLVVLAASASLGILSCSGGGEEVSTTPADQPGTGTTVDQPEASETTAAEEPAAPAALTWSRVEHNDQVFGGNDTQRMRSVARAGTQIVAVGFDTSGGDFDAAVWTSPDGLAWSRVPHDEAVFGGTDTQTMRSVAATTSGFVAVGNDGSDGDFDAAVWTSADGLAWVRVTHDETALGGDGNQQMDSVTAGNSLLVAVGLEQTEQIDSAVWTSTDGVTWTRVPHDEAVFGGESDQDMNSVVATASGFVAVGEDWSGGDPDAAVWNSPDGSAWSRVPHDEAVFGGDQSQKTLSVTRSESGLVAVGIDHSGGDFDAAVWTSPDGLAWSRVPHDESLFGGDANQQMDDVTLTTSGLVAVGLEETDEDWDGAAWTSPDGLLWSRVPHDEAVFGGDPNQQIVSVATTQSGVVAVGDQEAANDFDAAVWTGRFDG